MLPDTSVYFHSRNVERGPLKLERVGKKWGKDISGDAYPRQSEDSVWCGMPAIAVVLETSDLMETVWLTGRFRGKHCG